MRADLDSTYQNCEDKQQYFSVSKNKSTRTSAHSKDWISVPITSGNLAHAILNHTWTPIIWKNGHRNEENFESCKLAVFDFDDGIPTIAALSGSLSSAGLKYCIATTRNHQKEKHSGGQIKPACDRFRLVMAFAEVITSLPLYRYNMEIYTNHFKSDKKCVDGARLYFQSTDIVRADDGETLDVLPLPKDHVVKPTITEKIISAAESNKMSNNVGKFLVRGRVFGQGRAVSCYVTSLELFSLGFNLDQVLGMLKRAPFDRTDFKDTEVESAAHSAAKRFSLATNRLRQTATRETKLNT